MADQSSPRATMSTHTAAVYSQHANLAFEAALATRTASKQAAFLLPYLHPGLQVLDVGCGPGSVTLDLGQLVAPGQVVGIDIQPAQVEQAQAQASIRGATNVRFEVADIYALPFPDGAFDVAFVHAVLMHLREPVQALVELRRVLRPNGLVGVRDPDWGARLHAPTTPLLEQWRAIAVRVRQHNGGDPFMGRHHRRLLLEAGFARTEARASVESVGTREEVLRHAAFLKAQWQGFARTALVEGWVDQVTVDTVASEIDAWALRPEAFAVSTYCEAIGWVSD